MQKEEEQHENYEYADIELNQQGRPKQKVVFYQLTQEMKDEALEQLKKDETQLS